MFTKVLHIGAAIIMFVLRMVVLVFFIARLEFFRGLYDSYEMSVKLGLDTSAIQATQLSNQYILQAISSIGQLFIVFAVLLVFEFMYRGLRVSKNVDKVQQVQA